MVTKSKKIMKTCSKDRKLEIVEQFIADWETDQLNTTRQLCLAARNDDHEGIVVFSGQLGG